jgi:hypothetical protein
MFIITHSDHEGMKATHAININSREIAHFHSHRVSLHKMRKHLFSPKGIKKRGDKEKKSRKINRRIREKRTCSHFSSSHLTWSCTS